MRLLRSLQFKVGAGIVGTVALLFTVYLIWDYQFHRSQFLAEIEDSAGDISMVVLNGLIKVEMAGRHPELLQASIEQFASDHPIEGIYLLDKRGTIRFSSKPALVGTSLDRTIAGCRECHADGTSPPASKFINQSGIQVMRNVKAIRNGQDCRPCHSAQDSLIGLLVVDVGTEGVREKLNAVLNEMLIKAAMTIIGILLTLGLLMSNLVIRRLKRLTAHAGTLAEEREGPAPMAIEGADEIGQLGAAFNRMSATLDLHRREVKAKEELRGLLLDKIVRVQEGERRRISRELHDHVGQSLSALLLACQDGDGNPPGGNGRNHDVRERIRGLIDEVHQLAWEMRPSILDDYGLDSALQAYVDDTAKHCGFPIDYQCSSRQGMERLPGWVEVTLYRVAQEALTNVVRHSQASRASVVLLKQTGNVTLLIEDDGCGFDVPLRQNGHKGMGLIGMKERVYLCGGSCIVESTPKCGTTVRVKIPIVEGAQ